MTITTAARRWRRAHGQRDVPLGAGRVEAEQVVAGGPPVVSTVSDGATGRDVLVGSGRGRRAAGGRAAAARARPGARRRTAETERSGRRCACRGRDEQPYGVAGGDADAVGESLDGVFGPGCVHRPVGVVRCRCGRGEWVWHRALRGSRRGASGDQRQQDEHDHDTHGPRLCPPPSPVCVSGRKLRFAPLGEEQRQSGVARET